MAGFRAFAAGEPFMDVRAEGGDPPPPVFSEAFLYPRIGKGDARFVLAVAAEYEHLIRALGESRVRELLETPAPRRRRAVAAQVPE